MKIGIVGAGTVGTTLGEHFAAVGHEVLITNGRSPDSLSEKLTTMREHLEPLTFTELLDQAELIIVALPWSKVRDVFRGDIDWRARVVVDATNIIVSTLPKFEVDDLRGDSGSQIVARLAPSGRIVKAFNTLPSETMFAPAQTGWRRVLFIAGDDQSCVSTVSALIAGIGFQPVVIGELATAGRQMEIGGVFSRLELFSADDQPRSH